MQDYSYEIALQLIDGVGLNNAKHLIEHYGTGQLAFEDPDALMPQMLHNAPDIVQRKHKAIEQAKREMAFIEEHNIRVAYYKTDDYPYRLRECVDAPVLLYGLGNFDFNAKHIVSVVGTRQPSDRGKETCRKFVTDLSELLPGIVIVSGLAYGIDVTAHRAALDAGTPTIIIPAHGLDRIYPAVHRNVAAQAVTNGGILTEFTSGTTPERQNFVQRNRIIAGLADAVVVVESKERGGSLITAEMADSYSREVFAFPGRCDDTLSAGCNKLIKYNKARMIENAEDLLLAMMWEQTRQISAVQTELLPELEPDEQTVMDILRSAPDGMHINQLVMESKLAFAALSALAFTMEMKGLIKSLPGGMYRALK